MQGPDAAGRRRGKVLCLEARDAPPGQPAALAGAARRAARAPDIAPLLTRWSEGDRDALDQVLPLVYDELCRVAARQLRRERDGHTLDPGDVVHTLFVHLVDQRRASWRSRAQFFATAARMIRRILVDHARTRLAAKRGGSTVTMSLSSLVADPPLRYVPISDVLAVDRALERLAVLDAARARVVELRFFGGLSVEEAAHVTGLSTRTVKREWRMARAWLHGELRADVPDGAVRKAPARGPSPVPRASAR
jgi:RNA polymerase sigma-70 factor, ECF subfamily